MLSRVVAFLVVPLVLTVAQAHARSDSLSMGLAAVTTAAQTDYPPIGRSSVARPREGAKLAQRRKVNPDEQAGPRYNEAPPASTAAREVRTGREAPRTKVIVHDRGLHRGWRHVREYGRIKTKVVIRPGDNKTVIKRKIEY